jgi:hypothetical protein
MADHTTTVRRIKFLARMARAQNRADSPPHYSDADSGHQTVGISEVSLLLDLPRLPVLR